MKSHAKIYCAAIALTSIATSAYAEQGKTFRQKMSGFEFGAGIPLVTPLTGYNVFVGYVNKNASTFLGRRFGIRADFTIPSDLRLKGTLSNNPNKEGYLADASGTVMGFDLKLSDFSDKKIEIDAFKDDNKQPIEISDKAVDLALKIKNKNMGLLIDFYPFADTWFLGGIRLTGGYYFGDFDISVNANVNEDIKYSYKISDKNSTRAQQDYLRAQIAKGSKIGADFHWKYHGPYAGLGFDLGIWRGFKFFMDAGVVFAKAPKVTEKNIHDEDLHLQAMYEIRNSNGSVYSSGDQMVELLPDGISTPPNVNKIVQDTVGMVVQQTLNTYASDSQYSGVISNIASAYHKDIDDIYSINPSDLGRDVVYFLNGVDDKGQPVDAPAWVKNLADQAGTTNSNVLAETIDEIRGEWAKVGEDVKGGIQKDVNDVWADYDKAKKDAIKDANDFLDDYGIMPMVKIGFMYRF